MIYDAIEIRPRLDPDGKRYWHVSFDDTDTEEREAKKHYLPNPMGFFCYPRKWGLNRGFKTLKQSMIEAHEKKIALLQESLDKLRALEVPAWESTKAPPYSFAEHPDWCDCENPSGRTGVTSPIDQVETCLCCGKICREDALRLLQQEPPTSPAGEL